MKIQNVEVTIDKNYLDKVMYIPNHANGKVNHPDVKPGVIIRRNESFVFVLFCDSRTVQAVNPENLVWG